MSLIMAGGALFSAAYPLIMGARQKRMAKEIRENTADPGIQRNRSLDRVADALSMNYTNYNLPGYNKYVNQIGSNMASANNTALQAATSSADVLNTVTATQAQADNSMNNLAIQAASGREAALMRYMGAVQNQGQDQVRVNQEENNRFQAKLNEAASLDGAGNTNMMSGFQDALIGASAVGQSFMPRESVDPNTGKIITMDSYWNTYFKKKKQS